MPKKPPKNAFFFYMLHFKDQEARRGKHYGALMEVSKAASDSWKNMNAQQRGPFEKRAKEEKLGPRKEVEKFTSQGIPLSVIEKEKIEFESAQKTMMRTIKEIVNGAFINNAIGSQEFYFISGNYFIRVNDNFLPAEIAMVKFTFDNGIVSKYHTYVNPEKVPLGYQFEAKDYSEKSHRLPIPPNAKGEAKYQVILDEIDQFMGNPAKLPPVFTNEDDIPMITSFLREFSDFRGYGEEDPKRYRVYPLHQLFYDIKEEAVRNSPKGESIQSIHIAKALLNRDHYSYMKDTACNYHEDLDCIKFCALASVHKWAFVFADNICLDLNIPLVAGVHLPSESDLSHVNQADFSRSNLSESKVSTYSDTESMRSSSAPVSNLAMPKWGRRPKSPETPSKDEDFPSLGSHGRRGGPPKKRSDERDTNNPWNTSSSSSGASYYGNHRRDSDTEEKWHDEKRSHGLGGRADISMDSSVSRGMGRGSLLFRNESGFGRGRSHNDQPSERKESGSSRRDHSKKHHPLESELKEKRSSEKKRKLA